MICRKESRCASGQKKETIEKGLRVNSTELPVQFRRIRLTLAREPGHPAGDRDIGYTLLAPLNSEGRIDADIWRAHRDACHVTRHRDQVTTVGRLRRRPGGSWAFHYETETVEDDDAGYRLGEHRFAPGEYVTIKEDDGDHTYRVVSVRAV